MSFAVLPYTFQIKWPGLNCPHLIIIECVCVGVYCIHPRYIHNMFTCPLRLFCTSSHVYVFWFSYCNIYSYNSPYNAVCIRMPPHPSYHINSKFSIILYGCCLALGIQTIPCLSFFLFFANINHLYNSSNILTTIQDFSSSPGKPPDYFDCIPI